VDRSGYAGKIALMQGGAELFRMTVTIDHPNEDGWAGEQAETSPPPPKEFVPEPRPLTVKLLDGDSHRGQTAQAMVAVLHRRVYMVGLTPFAIADAAA